MTFYTILCLTNTKVIRKHAKEIIAELTIRTIEDWTLKNRNNLNLYFVPQIRSAQGARFRIPMSRRIASPAGGAGRAHYIVSPVSPGAFESLSHRSVHGCRQFGSCELVKCAQAACCRVACSAGCFPTKGHCPGGCTAVQPPGQGPSQCPPRRLHSCWGRLHAGCDRECTGGWGW